MDSGLRAENEEDKKDLQLNGNLKRRKREEDEDERGEDEPIRRRAWGSKIKSYPGSDGAELDLDALLKSSKQSQRLGSRNTLPATSKPENPPTDDRHTNEPVLENGDDKDVPEIKREPSDDQEVDPSTRPDKGETPEVKPEAETEGQQAGVFFKKRKAKNIRHK